MKAAGQQHGALLLVLPTVALLVVGLANCSRGGRELPATAPTNGPQVVNQQPFRVYPFGLSLPFVSVTFSEPVIGVQAHDLRVDGSASTKVSGSGAGPYVFSGYTKPPFRTLLIEVHGGAIVDSRGRPFQGMTWEHTLVKPGRDSDSDELSNELEVERHKTNPLVADTDGDGLPDGYETQHPCLDPLADPAHQDHGYMSELQQPDIVDSDRDGISDRDEFLQGTDPCK